MNKAGLAKTLSEKAQITKADASTLIDAFVESVIEGLQTEGSVRISGLGKFESIERPEKEYTDPRDRNVKVTKPAHNVVKFRASSNLNDALN